MRYRRLRFDIWLCLLLSFLVSLLPAKLVERGMADRYAAYLEEHVVADGDIGSTADETVFQAQCIDDLLAHDTFAVPSSGISYRNDGAGYFGSYYMYNLELPSGERVAAIYNMDGVRQIGDSIYTGEVILPVGRIVYEDLTESETFLSQIEHAYPLSRTDFYVDMMGGGGAVSEDTYEEYYGQTQKNVAQIITVVICFPIFHMIGSKIGIFPPFFTRKKKEESEWE